MRESPHPLVGALIEALPRDGRVLLVGVGSGRHIPPLVAAGLEIDAVEEDAARAAQVAQRFADERRVRVARSAYDHLPLEFSDYDGALSTHALLHGSPAGIGSVLAAIGARLKPGGLLHFTLGSIDDPRCGAGTMIDDATWAAESGPEKGIPHAYFDEKAARKFLAGWTVISLEQRSAAETAGRWAHSADQTAGMVHWFARLERRR